MKKWTATGPPQSRVSLSQVLQVRPCLNDVECLSLLLQTSHALQNTLLIANAGGSFKQPSSDSTNNTNIPLIFPDRLLLSTSGTVSLEPHFSVARCPPDFIHPLVSGSELYKSHLTEAEMERVGVFSLGKTIIMAASPRLADLVLKDLLTKMTSDQVSLFKVMEAVGQQLRNLVGTSPISQFVAQLCKVTLGWQSEESGKQPQPPPPPSRPPTLVEDVEISHIEFSRLNSSSSSLSTASLTSTLPRPPSLPRSSSPIIETNNNNNNDVAPPKLPPKPSTSTLRSTGSSAATSVCGHRKRKAPQRNPSRLYRIVKPLAELEPPTPSPATNKCVGPEFIVMSEAAPNVLDLATNYSRKDFVSRQIDIVMLNGQKFFIHCNAAAITAGEILDNVLRDQVIPVLFSITSFFFIFTDFFYLGYQRVQSVQLGHAQVPRVLAAVERHQDRQGCSSGMEGSTQASNRKRRQGPTRGRHPVPEAETLPRRRGQGLQGCGQQAPVLPPAPSWSASCEIQLEPISVLVLGRHVVANRVRRLFGRHPWIGRWLLHAWTLLAITHDPDLSQQIGTRRDQEKSCQIAPSPSWPESEQNWNQVLQRAPAPGRLRLSLFQGKKIFHDFYILFTLTFLFTLGFRGQKAVNFEKALRYPRSRNLCFRAIQRSGQTSSCQIFSLLEENHAYPAWCQQIRPHPP